MSKDYDRRRMLVRREDKRLKLLTVSQHKNGDIYIGFPRFPQIKWLVVNIMEQGMEIAGVDSPAEEGKLSLHARGPAMVRADSTPGNHILSIPGYYLLDKDGQRAGARHLVTIFMDQPQDIAASRDYVDRESDYFADVPGDALSPFALVLFAVPRPPTPRTFHLGCSFDMDDLETMLPHLLAGTIELKYHFIGWLAYQTKYMDHWPLRSLVCCYDGYWVPLFIGSMVDEEKRVATLRVELRESTYKFSDEDISIEIGEPGMLRP
jgi:hypothetical protein